MVMSATSTTADVVIIGGGPGGYVAAIRAAQLGLSTVCVEMEKTLGGTCVNVGCIPSKALLESTHHFEFARHGAAAHGIVLGDVGLDLATMLERKTTVVGQNTKGVEYLFKKNKVAWARGEGTLHRAEDGWAVEVRGAPPETNVTRYTAPNVIIATGSVPIELPFLPFDEERILSNVGALAIPRVPEHLIVVGGGVIGLELGSVWRRLGARVTVVELTDTILPGMDEDIVKEATRSFARQGLDLRTATRVTGGGRTEGGVFVEIEKDGNQERLEGDHVLVSVGRRPATRGIDPAALGLETGKRGEIIVDDQLRTNLPRLFAIGDCVPGPMLAHKAEEEGVIAAEVIAGKPVHMHYRSIPNVVYTWPEIATVGLTTRQAEEAGRKVRTGKFPFSANGRARSLGFTEGFVKFVADAENDELLGCHMIGPSVSELIAEVVLAFEYHASSEDIGITVHAHPTLSEVTKEAALATLGRALHF
jgi:dihydrolipoamide dehydrogenase